MLVEALRTGRAALLGLALVVAAAACSGTPEPPADLAPVASARLPDPGPLGAHVHAKVDDRDHSGPVKGAEVGTSTSLEEPVSIPGEGEIVHAGTKIAFPELVGEFRRVSAKRYDVEAHNIGIGYNRVWKSTAAVVSIFVYPRVYSREDGSQESAAVHHARVLESVRKKWGELEQVARFELPGEFGGLPCMLVVSEHDHRGSEYFFGRRTRTLTYVLAAKSWWVKVRVSTPADSARVTVTAAYDLLSALGLPSRSGLRPTNGD